MISAVAIVCIELTAEVSLACFVIPPTVGGAQLHGQLLWDTISNAQVQPVAVSNPGDPLASIAAPNTGIIVSPTHAYFDMNAKPANNTLAPGVYCGGLTIGNTNGVTFTMSPGTYIMAGVGLVMNSQAAVSGSGVTVYNTSSAGWGCSSNYSWPFRWATCIRLVLEFA